MPSCLLAVDQMEAIDEFVREVLPGQQQEDREKFVNHLLELGVNQPTSKYLSNIEKEDISGFLKTVELRIFLQACKEGTAVKPKKRKRIPSSGSESTISSENQLIPGAEQVKVKKNGYTPTINEELKNKIHGNFADIVKEVDPTHYILDYLFQERVLTESTCVDIRRLPSKEERARAVLTVVLNSSRDNICSLFITSLEKEYISLADKLRTQRNSDTMGIISGTVSVTPESSSEMRMVENEFINEFSNLLLKYNKISEAEAPKGVMAQLARLFIKICAVFRSTSFVVCVQCPTLEAVLDFREICLDGTLAEAFRNDRITEKYRANHQMIDIEFSVKMNEDDYLNCVEYFKQEFVEKVSVTRKKLLQIMEPRYGLLDKLLKWSFLKLDQFHALNELQSVEEINNELLNIVTREDKVEQYPAFYRALRETGQMHIVNYLTNNSVYNEDLDNIWPLTMKESTIVNYIKEYITPKVDHSCTNYVIEKFDKSGLLGWKQKEFIMKSRSIFTCLLDFVLRGSITLFKEFTDILAGKGYRHMLKLFEDGGILVPTEITAQTKLFDCRPGFRISPYGGLTVVPPDRQYIAAAMNEIIHYGVLCCTETEWEAIDDVLLELDKKSFKIVHVNLNFNIEFWCSTIESFVELRKVCVTGWLSDFIFRLFKAFKAVDIETNVQTKMSDETRKSVQKYFKQKDLESLTDDPRSQMLTSTLSVPVSYLLELLLELAVVNYISRWREIITNPERFIYRRLASVCRDWNITLTNIKRKLKKRLSRKALPYVRNIRLVEIIGSESHQITKVTLFKNKLFALNYSASPILVFSASAPYNRLHDVGVKIDQIGFSHVIDIAASSDVQSLYVLSDGNTIWNLKFVEDGVAVETWITSKNHHYWKGISVDHSGMLTVWKQSQTEITIYSPNREVITQFDQRSLQPVTGVGHVSVTSNNTLMMCADLDVMTNNRNDRSRYLFEMTMTTDVIRTYKGRTNLHKADIPSKFVLCRNGDLIVVLPEIHQVVLMDKELKLKRVLVNTAITEEPCHVCFDEEMGNLFVSTTRGKIIMYNIIRRPKGRPTDKTEVA